MRLAANLWKFIKYGFTCFSVIFTLVKASTQFFPAAKIEGPTALTLIIVISIAYGLGKTWWKPSRVNIPLAHCNTTIEVLFGDLFEQDGIRVIPVNEFFDSKLGKPVSDKSVHGVFLRRCFGGQPESFDKQVGEELREIKGDEIAKIEGKTKRYPIGTTAVINVNQDRYIAFASAKTDPDNCKAFSDVGIMWKALLSLWKRARIESGGYPINLPLVGSGLSGVGLPIRDLLDLIVLSAISETKVKEIAQKIRVVLHRDRFGDIDLKDVQRHWRE